jgi:hypothetical protein
MHNFREKNSLFDKQQIGYHSDVCHITSMYCNVFLNNFFIPTIIEVVAIALPQTIVVDR